MTSLDSIISKEGSIIVSPDGEYDVSDSTIREYMICVGGEYFPEYHNFIWNRFVLHKYLCYSGIPEKEQYSMGYPIISILVVLCNICAGRKVERITNPSKLVSYLKEWMKSNIDVIERIERKYQHAFSTQNEIGELFYEELVRIWKNDIDVSDKTNIE